MVEKNYTYDLLMVILSIIAIILLVAELSLELSDQLLFIFSILNIFIWIIFFIDYTYRLYISKNKIEFVKNNIIDLLSIMPFDAAFKSFRVLKILKIGRLFRLAKIFILISKFRNKLNVFLKTNNFNYVLYLTLITIFSGAIGISIVEKMDFSNALWWSFVTTTTVGYGDISPTTSIGRIIAVLLMLVGIGFIGMLTGTISTFFLKKKEKKYKDEIIENVINKLQDFDSLSAEDLQDMFNSLSGLKK